MHWKLFDQLFKAFSRRKAAERVTRLKESMISGVWGNSNYDDKDARTKILREIDRTFSSAIAGIYGAAAADAEIDPDDPFFSAMKVPEMDEEAAIGDDRESLLAELDQM